MRVVAGYKVVVVGSRANDPRSLVKTMLQCFARCDGGIFRIGRRRSLGLCTKAREYSKAAVTILNMHLPATTTHDCRANGRELSIMSFTLNAKRHSDAQRAQIVKISRRVPSTLEPRILLTQRLTGQLSILAFQTISLLRLVS